MRTLFWLAVIAVLVSGIVFFSYMTYVYLYVADFLPAQEESATLSYRFHICDLQNQLGYERCEVDGLVLEFGDLSISSPMPVP